MATLTTGLRPITAVAAELGLDPSELELYGHFKAKVRLDALTLRRNRPDGHVVLVTAINPTPAGEGKTVTAIALAQALRAGDVPAVVCLRQPSMGPVFGLKGGATGGGRCTVEPAADINLHFTGDFHAVTAANNLLAALLDDHVFRGREPRLDVQRPTFHRVLDTNDRALRHVIVGLGSAPREDRFDITAASEVMAILGLARDFADLRDRLGRIVVGETHDGAPITAEDLHAAGAMAALLRDALHPNLAQTQDGGPAFIHTGPFANIAHGTCSLVSLLLARKLAPYVVVEAGFGADLGAEKFVNLVGEHGGPQPRAAVIVATIRALKYHGGIPLARLGDTAPEALAAGLLQLRHHVEIARRLGMRPVICLNAFDTDRPDELDAVRQAAREWEIPAAVSTAFTAGSAGAADLARLVMDACAAAAPTSGGRLYGPENRLAEKLDAVARSVYNASGVALSPAAATRLRELEARGFGRLPICIAKTQYSLTDDPHIGGVPHAFAIHIRDVEVRAGAGFVLVLAGDMMTMPALPARPRAWAIEMAHDGSISGIE
jgi:formate--tetrahydrofolate ligase